MPIPITKIAFGPEEEEAVLATLRSGWILQGARVAEFERSVSNFTCVPHAIAVSSCTAALHVAVAALQLKPGDEVLVPAFTWIATANVVEFMGAKPIFCDIDLKTFNIDPKQLEHRITSRTVGIIPVHLFGLCADMQPILKIAADHNLWVIEDAACALGSQYFAQHAGTLGDLGCFRFHPRKSITTGEGGMLVSKRDDLAQICISLRDHGVSRPQPGLYHDSVAFLFTEFNRLGFNYRMTDIQGALGCVQMTRLTDILAARRRIAQRYDELLTGISWLKTPGTPDGYLHTYQAYVCLFEVENPSISVVQRLHRQRNELMAALQKRGISSRPGTHAPVVLGYYARKYGLRPEEFPNAYLADRLSLALPLYPQLTDQEQTFVAETLAELGTALEFQYSVDLGRKTS